MRNFIKFPSLHSLENIKNCERDYTNANLVSNWVVTEKIDGSNIQFIIDRDGYDVASRNLILTKDDKFSNIWENVPHVEGLISKLQEHFFDPDDHTVIEVHLYGEYFGRKVMNRIRYNKDPNIEDFRFFALMIIIDDGSHYWYSFYDMHEILKLHGYEHMIVPIKSIVKTFKEAIAVQNSDISFFCTSDTPDDRDYIEGTVIVPLYDPPKTSRYQYMFKNKNPKFSEIHCKRKFYVEKTVEDIGIEKAHQIFIDYCTESRMYSLLSKYDESERSQSGKMIPEFLNDAKKDFLSDNPAYVEYDKNQLKKICNVGSLSFNIYNTVMSKLKD